MYSSGHVDWLAVTFPASVNPNATLPPNLCQSPWLKQSRGAHGYRQRLTNEIGAAIMLDGDTRQGVHLVMSGSALTLAREMGVTDRELCNHVVNNDGKVARLDVAINVYEGNLTPVQMARAYEQGSVKTPARHGSLIQDIKTPGSDFRLGSRSSERYFRAYDKAAEQHVDHVAWLRLELELKKLRARALADTIASETNTRGVINHAIRDYVQMSDNDEFEQATSEQAGEIPSQNRKLHNTLKWLIDVVAPSMARYQSEHPDEDIEAILHTSFKNALERFTLAQDDESD
jgi:DNA relaxase NicK